MRSIIAFTFVGLQARMLGLEIIFLSQSPSGYEREPTYERDIDLIFDLCWFRKVLSAKVVNIYHTAK